jgi:soluble lytic murein transglycosylase
MSVPRLVPAVTLSVALGVGACSCHGSTTTETRPPAEPAAAAIPAAPAPSEDAGSASSSVEPPLDRGLPPLSVVLDDPRLAAVRERDRAHDPAGAAHAVEAARASAMQDPSAPLDATRACGWAFVAGRFELQAGQYDAAATQFAMVFGAPGDAGVACALEPYARLRAAEAHVHAGQADAALDALRPLPDDFAGHDEARLATADAYVIKSDRASAIPLWRAVLASAPHGVRWADTSLQLARALLDGVAGPPADHAQDALDLATRVMIESPGVLETSDVIQLRARAAQALHRAAPPFLTPAERVRQAQAWLDDKQPRRATEVAEALLDALGKGKPKDPDARAAGCKAAILVAQALPRGKQSASADAWTKAIDRCADDDGLVTALYFGAKASASAHRDAEALDRFARVEKLFPTHRLADDARMRAAQVVFDQGDAAKYRALLATLPDAYPGGDMKGEALFRLAFDAFSSRDLPAARDALDKLLTMPSEDRAAGSAGRAAYFRARVSQLSGDVQDARRRYEALVEAQPLSFYMLLAVDRLRGIDPSAVAASLAAAQAHVEPPPFLSHEHPEIASPSFERFQRLLEVGETDAARREASAGGLTAEGVDPEVLWAVAWSYDRAGLPDLGHAYARSRLVDFRAHWPAGRWKLPWQVAYPRAWAATVAAESQAAGIPSPLTWSIMREESAFNPDAKSGANAFGLMQLLLGTARGVAKGTPLVVDEDALRRPEMSISLGARLLASMRASFPANPSLAVAAYNCGSGNVRRWLGERGGDAFDEFVERIPFEETRNYVKRVLTSEAAYAYLYAPDTLNELFALPEIASGQRASAGP